MASSIRWRLQLWHGAVLALTLLGFGLLMYWSARNSWFRELDTSIEGQLHYLDIHLRRLPPWFHEGDTPPLDRPPPDRPPPPGVRPPPRGPDGPVRNLKRFLEELRLPSDSEPPPGAPPPDPAFFQIRRADGTIIKSEGDPEGLTQLFEGDRFGPEPEIYHWHQFRIGFMGGPGETTILVGRSTTSIRNRLGAFSAQMWFFGAVAMVLGLGGGWVIASGILKPIEKISTNLTQIRATDLSKRISIPGLEQEMVGLAQNLNGMLDRLEESFRVQTRFTADASHEMRTPLAAIRSQCELALRKLRTPEEYQEALTASLRGVSRLENLVEDLLALARCDSNKTPQPKQIVDLQPLIDECIHEISKAAKVHQIQIHSTLLPLLVHGDATQLDILFSNLLRNAVHHNKDNGEIWVQMHKAQDKAIIEIKDTGIGIPPEAVKHLGERFFRADPSRTREGNGLGLAICKSVLQTHNGVMECESELGKGSVFRVILSLASTYTDAG